MRTNYERTQQNPESQNIFKVSELVNGDIVGPGCDGLIGWPAYRHGRNLNEKQVAYAKSRGLLYLLNDSSLIAEHIVAGSLRSPPDHRAGKRSAKSRLRLSLPLRKEPARQ